jgi:hypothetical protein
MHTSAEFHVLAERAYADALEYREAAETAAEPRKVVLLKWAENREADAKFYLSRISVLRTCLVQDCDNDVFKKGYCSSHYHRVSRYGDPLMGRTSPGEPEKFLQQALSSNTDDCIDWPYAKAGAGYGVIQFGEGLRFYVHRFICETVKGVAPSDVHQAAHSCGRGAEGCINPRHLRWATPAENIADKFEHGTTGRGEKGGMAKLTDRQVLEIRELRSKGETEKNVSKIFNVSRSQISRITKRENWSHI